MKRIVLAIVCVLGVTAITSCRSTAPCGLSSENTKQIQYDQHTEAVVAEVVE